MTKEKEKHRMDKHWKKVKGLGLGFVTYCLGDHIIFLGRVLPFVK